ncbi:DUF1045 domain-containing protein [Rhodobacterales bacterium]|nr:DUF1045 domain-containing protein [Rhodobacterales bacterium]
MRYAIYFAADANDPLMQLGSAWLGRDPFSEVPREQPSVDGLSPERFAELTASPRRYGFHGTLKAPFSLAPERSEAELVKACSDFATDVAPFMVESFVVNRLGRFLALTPEGDEPDLAAFASLCVRRFEPFRAPLGEADLERRRKSALTPRQDAYLMKWGYPYIFDEFRFHMTLSDKLDDETDAARMETAARTYFAELTGRPRSCASFALYTEAERGAPFRVHTVFALTGTTPPKSAASAGGDPLKENA